MSLDPGTALAVVSLTFQAFAGCVKGFVLLSTAHNLPQPRRVPLHTMGEEGGLDRAGREAESSVKSQPSCGVDEAA